MRNFTFGDDDDVSFGITVIPAEDDDEDVGREGTIVLTIKPGGVDVIVVGTDDG